MADSIYEAFRIWPIRGANYAYTTGPATQHDGVGYIHLDWTRGDVSRSIDSTRSSVNIDMPVVVPFLTDIAWGDQSQRINVRIYRIKNEYNWTNIFNGHVTSTEISGASLRVSADSILSRTNDNGLLDTYAHTCRHKLYSKQCGVPKSRYTRTRRITKIDSNNVFYLDDGALFGNDKTMVNYSIEIDGITRVIASLSQAPIVTTAPFPEGVLTVGKEVRVTSGCSKYRDECRDKFKNIVNFGGFNHIPLQVVK